MLIAVQQAEDALAQQRYLAEQLIQQRASIGAAQNYLDLANTRYRAGLAPHLHVYTAATNWTPMNMRYID